MTLALLAGWTLRSSIVLGSALGLSIGLARRSAALRHWVLAVGAISALCVPLMTPVTPHWSLPALSPAPGASAPAAAPTGETDVTFAVAAGARPIASNGESQRSQAGGWPWFERALLLTWLGGAGLLGIALVAGLLRVAAIAHRSTLMHDDRWTNAAIELGRERPALRDLLILESDSDVLLITWGIRPRVLLPRSARQWSDERIAIVLSHEAAHIVRRDWVVLMAAELLRCVFWFNPLAWTTVNRLRLESERACDDLVLAEGVEASDYAQHLLDVARTLSRSQAWTPMPAMARASSLERRVSAMLDEQVSRGPLTRLARYAAAVPLLAMTVSVASFAAQSQFATVSGTLKDQLGGTIPNVTVTLVNVQNGAKHEIKSNANGSYEFVGVPAGNYTFASYAPGFKTIEVPLQVAAGQTLHRDTTLDVGTLQETIAITEGPGGWNGQVTGSSKPISASADACTAQPNSGGIKPPMKVKDVKPIYPGSMTGSGLEGKVSLRATIGLDGAVKTIQTLDATNPDFESAAQDAVRQWRFTATLLNCVPIEVQMNVAVAFKPQSAAPPPPPPPPPPPQR